jgi:hypothetical protein
MEKIARTSHRIRDGVRIAHVTFDNLDVEVVDIDPIARRTQKDADEKSGPKQRARHGRSHEARRARDKYSVSRHSDSSPEILFVDVALVAPAAAYHFCSAIGNRDRKSLFAALIWLRQRNLCLGAGGPIAVMAAISHSQVFLLKAARNDLLPSIAALARPGPGAWIGNPVRLYGLEHFQAKWTPVRVKKMRRNKDLEPRSDSIGTGL